MSRDRVAQLVCPGCGVWKRVKRHMIEPHTCTGGGQRIWIDVDTAVIERHYRRQQRQPDPSLLRTDGKPRHRNPYDGIDDPPALPGEVNPDPPQNGRGEALLPNCSRM